MPQDDEGLDGPGPTESSDPTRVPVEVGTRTFRLLVVPGVSPAKWLRVWEERLPDVPVTLVHAAAGEAMGRLRAGEADAGLLRLPVDRADLSAIPLYTETTVVVAPADHVVTAADELTPADLVDEVLLVPDDDVVPWPDRPGEVSALPAPATTAEAIELVAAGVGVLVVPQSLARLHHRRDLTYRPVADAPASTVALAWLTDGAPDLVEELIGIVRGRTVNSSRGRAAAGAAVPGHDTAAAPRTAGPGTASGGGRAGRAGSPQSGRGGGTRGTGGRRAGGPRDGGGRGGGRGGRHGGSGGTRGTKGSR